MWLGAQEELAEFNAEEKDVLQSIGALKSAIIVLSKHHEFLQTVPSEQLINIAAMLQWQFHKHKDMLALRKNTSKIRQNTLKIQVDLLEMV